MSYSDFTLKKAKSELGLKIIEDQDLFSDFKPVPVSKHLSETLKQNLPLALAINTGKARSELIIINILLEIKNQVSQKISLFSGIEMNVDRERGLNGFCDFILSQSSEQLYLDAPIVTIVEAKNENIVNALGQCIASMYAAKIFNEKEEHSLSQIYGAVTTGDEWKFLKLEENHVFIDTVKYYSNDLAKIIGILIQMTQ